jgi:hypothetical protein
MICLVLLILPFSFDKFNFFFSILFFSFRSQYSTLQFFHSSILRFSHSTWSSYQKLIISCSKCISFHNPKISSINSSNVGVATGKKTYKRQKSKWDCWILNPITCWAASKVKSRDTDSQKQITNKSKKLQNHGISQSDQGRNCLRFAYAFILQCQQFLRWNSWRSLQDFTSHFAPLPSKLFTEIKNRFILFTQFTCESRSAKSSFMNLLSSWICDWTHSKKRDRIFGSELNH